MKGGFGSGLMPYAALAQGVGTLMTRGAKNMDEGWKKDLTMRAGNFLAGGGAFASDVAMTASTMGLNKVIQGAGEMFRLYGTD
jgi:hypothetical protein